MQPTALEKLDPRLAKHPDDLFRCVAFPAHSDLLLRIHILQESLTKPGSLSGDQAKATDLGWGDGKDAGSRSRRHQKLPRPLGLGYDPGRDPARRILPNPLMDSGRECVLSGLVITD